MNRSTKAVAAATVGLVVVGLGASASAAPDETPIRQSDFLAKGTATNGDATVDFLKEGIHIKVPDASTDYAIGVFATNTPLADVNNVEYTWYGTDSKPGVKYNVDVNGDDTWDCQLVGEQVYGGQDVWLNRQNADSTLDGGACADAAPTTSGGSGAPEHGTLDQWAASFSSTYDETPVVVQTGYGASGLSQDGVLRSIGLGPTTYVFTSEAEATPTPTKTPRDTTVSYARRASSGLALSFRTNTLTANQSEGRKARVEVLLGYNGATLYKRVDSVMGANEASYFTQSFGDNRTRRVVIKVNGATVANFTA